MDFINGVSATPAAKGNKRARFVSPTARLDDETVQGATREVSTRKGLEPGWKRHTIVVHDDWVALVEEMKDELSITAMDAWRYLLRLGIRDYQAGERPELERRPRALNRLVD
jgi:hypothetical protein